MKISQPLCFTIVIATIVLLAAFPGWAEDEDTTIRVVYGRSIDDLPLYVGLEEGFWEEEGLSVELVRLTGEHNIIAAALHGDIHAGMLDPGGFFPCRASGNTGYRRGMAGACP